MNKLTLVLVLTVLIYCNLTGNIINVPGNQPNIQFGINAANDFDTVLVEEGTYYENINLKGKKILLTSRYLSDGNTDHILNTVINGSTPQFPDSASCIRIISKEDSNTIIQGFTLTEGTGTIWPDVHYGNTPYREGGGIFIDSSSPVIMYNIIVNNQAINCSGVHNAGGGAIRAADSDPGIIANMIINNQGNYGAGIVLYYSSGNVKNNVVCTNSGGSYFGGGGIWVYGNINDSVLIINNNIIDNISYSSGGGLFLYHCTALVTNNIIWGNTSTGTGPQIRQIGGDVNVSYSDIQDGYSGFANLNLDPDFSDLVFHLSSTSPCIDSGDPMSEPDPEDSLNPGFAQYPSMGTIRTDIGVYGGANRIEFPDFSSFVGIEEVEFPALNENLSMKVIYLNDHFADILFELEKEQMVTIKIYDITGSLIRSLLNQTLHSGLYHLSWNLMDNNNINVENGIYFIKLNTDYYILSKKICIFR